MTLRPIPSHPLLDRLWAAYARDVPFVQRFVALHARMHDGRPFENDHIALRTVARTGRGSGLAVFVPVFERLGWTVRDAYTFADVHLHAVYLAQPGLPRVFVSELDIDALPADARAAILRAPADPPAPTDLDALADWFAPPLPPSRADVELVARHSQYGAWCLCFGRRVNHFTAAVDDVATWQARLLDDGVPMKAEIEGAPIPPGGTGLRQTATAAAELDVTFADGTSAQKPYAYFEIAERHGGFDGFLAQQARQLFDQTKR
jgi:hypothetical protein